MRRVQPKSLPTFIRGGVETPFEDVEIRTVAVEPLAPRVHPVREEEAFVFDAMQKRHAERDRENRLAMLLVGPLLGAVAFICTLILFRAMYDTFSEGWQGTATLIAVGVPALILVVIAGVFWGVLVHRTNVASPLHDGPVRDTPTLTRTSVGEMLPVRLAPLIGQPSERVRWLVKALAAYVVVMAAIVVSEGMLAHNWAVVGNPFMILAWVGGLALVYHLGKYLYIARAFGRVCVEIDANPVQRGRTLAVRARADGAHQLNELALHIRCRLKTYRGGSRNLRIDTLFNERLWTDFDLISSDMPLNIAASFHMPNEARPDGDYDGGAQVMWCFVVEADVKRLGKQEVIFPFTVV